MQVRAILTRKAINTLLGQEVWRQANTEFEKLRVEVAFPPGSQEVVKQVQTGQRTKTFSSHHSSGLKEEASKKTNKLRRDNAPSVTTDDNSEFTSSEENMEDIFISHE